MKNNKNFLIWVLVFFLVGCTRNQIFPNDCIDLERLGTKGEEVVVRHLHTRILAVSNEYYIYPVEARDNGIEGTVELLVSVSKQGKIDDVSIHDSSGHKALDEAAMLLGSKLKSHFQERPLLKEGRCFSKKSQFVQPVRYALSERLIGDGDAPKVEKPDEARRLIEVDDDTYNSRFTY
ncbi:energy transducer TonB [Marinobacter salarius]|uniref:energy transducer TonB n=1 Tax=Marinobacter TaxID=2742 RepID=UPI001D18CAF1|nr:energy transducer TonB [Marinobacter salarius]MCC4283538.1 energy transducer TonB [Marinobacter salarius]